MVVTRRAFNLLFIRHISGKPSYFHRVGKEPLRPLTIGALLDEAADKWADRTAILSHHEGQSITFSQLKHKAEELAGGLLELGFQPGDRVGLIAPNTIFWCVAMVATAKIGVIQVSLNPSYQVQDLSYCIDNVKMNGLIMDRNFRKVSYYDMLKTIAPEIEDQSSKDPIKIKQFPHLTRLIINSEIGPPGTVTCSELVRMGKSNLNAVKKIQESLQPDEPMNVQFSSGTTGPPKGALLHHFGLVNNAYFFGKRTGLDLEPHSICLQVPFFHTFGACVGFILALCHGNTIVLASPFFNADQSIEAFKKHRITAIYGTPTMYVDLLAKIKRRASSDPELAESVKSVKVVVCGGAVCSPQLLEEMSKSFHCKNINSAYGMTEMSPITFTNLPLDDDKKRFNTVGSVADHCEVKVVDAEGRMVPFGTPGEAWFRSYSAMSGYFNNPDKTKEAMTECGWMKSGDLITMDEEGYGVVVGRLKDIINRGGENIFPSEIEDFLARHPAVHEVQVYGVDDERLGEEVCVSIRLKPGEKCTPESIKAFCQGQIAHFKIPRYIEFVEDFPRTLSGKIQKFELQKMMKDKLKKST